MRYNGFPLGDITNRNINLRTGQAPVIPYYLLKEKLIRADIITHKLALDEAEHGYEVFDTKTEGCIKVILKP